MAPAKQPRREAQMVASREGEKVAGQGADKVDRKGGSLAAVAVALTEKASDDMQEENPAAPGDISHCCCHWSFRLLPPPVFLNAVGVEMALAGRRARVQTTALPNAKLTLRAATARAMADGVLSLRSLGNRPHRSTKNTSPLAHRRRTRRRQHSCSCQSSCAQS